VLSGGNRINPDHLSYYTGWAELTAHPGTWWTQAEEAFGVDSGGAVDAKRLRAFLRGEGARQRKDRHPGLEFTFSAPKSVSVVAFGHPSEALGVRVIEAHEAAVRSALGWLEDHGAVVVRHRPGGVHRFEPARGVYALFWHSTSRAGDPQLHTHVLVPNLAADRSCQLGATDRHILKAWVEPASSIYKLALRAELATMGLRFATPRQNGLAELEGMPERTRRRFSHRRRAIEAHVAALERQGVEVSPRLRRLLGVYTRAKKPTGNEAAEIEDVRGWLRLLLEKHAVDEWLWAQMFNHPFSGLPASTARAKELLDRLLEDDGALSAMSSWNRKELIAKLPTVLPEGASPEALDERLVRLVYVEETGQVARRAGRKDLCLVVASEEDLAVPSTLGVRFTSKALLQAEHRILVAAATWVWRTGRCERQVADAVLDEATGSGRNAPPNPEQANLVRHFVCSDRAITLGVGVPGSGKTSAMTLCVAAWRRLRVPVVALSFKGRSALELGRAAGMRGSTVDHFLALYDHGKLRIAPGSVILVESAGPRCGDEVRGGRSISADHAGCDDRDQLGHEPMAETADEHNLVGRCWIFPASSRVRDVGARSDRGCPSPSSSEWGRSGGAGRRPLCGAGTGGCGCSSARWARESRARARALVVAGDNQVTRHATRTTLESGHCTGEHVQLRRAA
jgi:conjugative relaxase-like TrwC/TraI family protein